MTPAERVNIAACIEAMERQCAELSAMLADELAVWPPRCRGRCAQCEQRPCDRPQHDDAAHVCDACTPF